MLSMAVCCSDKYGEGDCIPLAMAKKIRDRLQHDSISTTLGKHNLGLNAKGFQTPSPYWKKGDAIPFSLFNEPEMAC